MPTRAALMATNAPVMFTRMSDSMSSSETYVAVDAGGATEVAELVARTNADVLHYNTGVLRYRANGSLETNPITNVAVNSLPYSVAACSCSRPGLRAPRTS